ncbi:MAG TPA: hypothetical protein VL043_00360 [Protaetiibacter sp.]|jgi:hypothetical protein|nr:hypothetical protein [Protaetiibacter sp.]
MVEKEHRTRDGTLVEPGELAAKERQRARGIVRGTPTLPLPVIRPAADPAADAELTGEDDAPRSA